MILVNFDSIYSALSEYREPHWTDRCWYLLCQEGIFFAFRPEVSFVDTEFKSLEHFVNYHLWAAISIYEHCNPDPFK